MSFQQIVPYIGLIFVIIFTIIRKVGNLDIPIWLIMIISAIFCITVGSINLNEALKAIDLDVIIFLFCMFLIAESFQSSGYLYHIAHKIFSNTESARHLLLVLIFFSAAVSGLLMNDTMIIIGTPLVIYFARKHNISTELLLLTLMYSVTIGSVFSPIGNPQNLLIAINSKMNSPFILFFIYLLPPTIANLFVLYFFMNFIYRNEIHTIPLIHEKEELEDPSLAKLCRISLIILLVAVLLKILIIFINPKLNLPLTYIAIAGLIPIAFGLFKRSYLLKKLDWGTLIFFVGMFILMKSIWNTEIIQHFINKNNINLSSTPILMIISVIFSQILSNVPLVALFMPILKASNANISLYMALAASSTLAGNFLILGAASNVIAIQNAEKLDEKIPSVKFSLIGIPLGIINLLVINIWFLFLNFINIEKYF